MQLRNRLSGPKNCCGFVNWLLIIHEVDRPTQLLEKACNALCTLQEHQRIRTFVIYQKFLILTFYHRGLWKKVFFTTYFVSHRNPISVKINGKYIYIEKFNKVWRSDLCWDIYGSNKDDPDIYGFLSHWQQC